METWRKMRKIAAVSKETPENTKNSQSQNTLDPEMAQEYISQVSEEIEVSNLKTQKNSVGRSLVFWVLCLNLTNFFRKSDSDIIRSFSGNIQEQRLRKTRTHWGSFSKRLLYRSGALFPSL